MLLLLYFFSYYKCFIIIQQLNIDIFIATELYLLQ